MESSQEQQIDCLEEIGFIWTPAQETYKITALEQKHTTWLKHYEELKQFKEKYGHYKVPSEIRKFRALRAWVNNQRREELTDEQKYLLDEINFFEELGYFPWEIMIDRLLDFKNKFGHLHINSYLTDDKQLLNSVRRIRYSRDKLSAEKISMLNDLEFIWKSINPVWIKYYEELKAFKQKYSTCHISVNNKEFPSLGQWVNFHRKNKYLSDEKRRLLDEIGFFNEK